MRYLLCLVALSTLFVSKSLSAQEINLARSSLDPLDTATLPTGLELDDQGRPILNRHDLWVHYFLKDEDVGLTFLSFLSLGSQRQEILVQKDYVHYQHTQSGRVGVLIRLEAEVVIEETSIQIENLQDIGAATELGISRGDIRVKVWGLDGPSIYDISIGTTFDSVSLNNLENSLNDLNSKILDDSEILLHPVVLPDEIFMNQRQELR